MDRETGAEFAARYWGGEGVEPVPIPAQYGPPAVDGGRPFYPAGWMFRADGFRYRVWPNGKVWHIVCLAEDTFAMFRHDGTSHWVIDHGWDRRTSRQPDNVELARIRADAPDSGLPEHLPESADWMY